MPAGIGFSYGSPEGTFAPTCSCPDNLVPSGLPYFPVLTFARIFRYRNTTSTRSIPQNAHTSDAQKVQKKIPDIGVI
jgi:hypothetical protein